MGKDNVPFHTLTFPGTLLGSGEPWKLVDQLKSFNWLAYYGGKFSTSQGRGVFMDQALDLLPADCWRWFLMTNAPESDDANFTWDLVGEAVNKDLVGTLGNFVNRTATQVTRHFGDVVPEGGEPGDPERRFVERVRVGLAEYCGHMDALEFRKATAALRAVWAEGNVYLEEREPWRAIKSDREVAALTLRTALGFTRVAAAASCPFIPTASEALAGVLPDARLADPTLHPDLAGTILDVPAGSPFAAPGLLFQKLDDEQLAAWAEQFAGSEDG
jgi:methionyl-tRNA synthetase